MTAKASMKGVQKNLSIEQDVLDVFERFCNARGASMGYVASAALLEFLKLKPDDRDQVLLQLGAWIAGDPEARSLDPDTLDAPERRQERRAARAGARRVRQKSPR